MLKTDSKKLETRDFISVGIFSLIYSVVAFVIGLLHSRFVAHSRS